MRTLDMCAKMLADARNKIKDLERKMEVIHMPEFYDWQHAALLNQIIANIKPSEKSGFYKVDMSLSARQCDELQELANVFDKLARAQGGPPKMKDPGGG